MITQPHGILLVTGPTGSGKTTSLYASLNSIVSPELKVLTVEDPVEYNLESINQVNVNNKAGLTFAQGMLDIDRDGDLDFAALLGNSIAIVESATGRGPTEFFSNAYVDNWSSSFNEIQSGDIDNDGDDDLITNTSQGLSWLENADDYGGTWIAHPISPFTYTDLTCVDFDGDGDNDIVANGVFSQTGVRFLENLDGNGTFAPDQLLATTNNLRDFVFADIDGDGFDDIAVTANQFQSLGWFRFNQQTQNYEPIEYIQTPFSNLGRIAAADFDDDNDIDLLVAHNEFGIYGWLRNNGTGEFELGQQFSSPALRPINIQAVDLNSDQYSDILVGSNSSAALGWHINTNGLGSFTNVPELQFVDGHRAAYMRLANTKFSLTNPQINPQFTVLRFVSCCRCNSGSPAREHV